MSIIKKIFSKKLASVESNEFEKYIELRLLIEMAYSDGSLDKAEENIIFTKAKKIIGNKEETEAIIAKLQHESKTSTSLHSIINEINNSFNRDEKLELLKNLWGLICVDSIIEKYEESLYFKIAELIKIKRPIANKIKIQNS